MSRGNSPMSAGMITRCPQCSTAFRIYEHQLAEREGRVRCGACSEVFDAYESLEAEREPARGTGSPAPAEARGGVAETSIAAEVAQTPQTVREPGAGAAPAPPAGPESVPIAESPPPAPPAAVDDPGAGYDFGPPRAPPSRRAAHAIALALGCALLATQALYWFRSELAARFPPLRSPLESMCRLAGCTITLPAVAAQMAIESLDLQADGNFLVLVSTLRNNATYTQAFPALELTLTDGRDQPLARRVLKPEDYLDPSVRPEGGVRAGAEVLVRAYIDASSLNTAGYRMVLFYP